VSGKVAGYGKRAMTGTLGQVAAGGTGQAGTGEGFASSFHAGSSFAATDFVGTMPGLSLSGVGRATQNIPGSGFGITLTTPPTPVHAAKRAAHLDNGIKIIDPDTLLHPFTHPIAPTLGEKGLNAPMGLGSSSH